MTYKKRSLLKKFLWGFGILLITGGAVIFSIDSQASPLTNDIKPIQLLSIYWPHLLGAIVIILAAINWKLIVGLIGLFLTFVGAIWSNKKREKDQPVPNGNQFSAPDDNSDDYAARMRRTLDGNPGDQKTANQPVPPPQNNSQSTSTSSSNSKTEPTPKEVGAETLQKLSNGNGKKKNWNYGPLLLAGGIGLIVIALLAWVIYKAWPWMMDHTRLMISLLLLLLLPGLLYFWKRDKKPLVSFWKRMGIAASVACLFYFFPLGWFTEKKEVTTVAIVDTPKTKKDTAKKTVAKKSNRSVKKKKNNPVTPIVKTPIVAPVSPNLVSAEEQLKTAFEKRKKEIGDSMQKVISDAKVALLNKENARKLKRFEDSLQNEAQRMQKKLNALAVAESKTKAAAKKSGVVNKKTNNKVAKNATKPVRKKKEGKQLLISDYNPPPAILVNSYGSSGRKLFESKYKAPPRISVQR